MLILALRPCTVHRLARTRRGYLIHVLFFSAYGRETSSLEIEALVEVRVQVCLHAWWEKWLIFGPRRDHVT